MFDSEMHELVLLNSVFVQILSKSFGSLFLGFPGRRSPITFEIKTGLKIKHLKLKLI